MTNTKKHGVKLDTLKECFQFLDWLHKRKDKQGGVVNRLFRRLKPYYDSKSLSEESVKYSLSGFLYQVSHFYDKLCHTLPQADYSTKTAKQLLDALLHCKPKLLAALHFLWYNVDDKFALAGGGTWKNDKVALHSSDVSKIDAYFIADRGDGYGVIPGGFEHGALKEGHKGGYTDGSVIASNLPKILSNLQNNFFSDVFVTSVSSTAGSQASNTANSLALLKTFCDIIDDKDQEAEKALNGYINENGDCINWEELKAHCTTLKEYLGNIFDAGVLSYTGNSPNVGILNKEKFARKMAKWLRDNLDKVRGSLKDIKTHDYNHAAEYFTKHFFPYGFIFDKRALSVDINGSGGLQQKWVKVIEMLHEYGEGLDRTVEILKGQHCDHTHHRKADPDEEDEEDDDDDDDDDNDDEEDDEDGEDAAADVKKDVRSAGDPNQIMAAEGIPPLKLPQVAPEVLPLKQDVVPGTYGHQHQGGGAKNSPGSSVGKSVVSQSPSINFSIDKADKFSNSINTEMHDTTLTPIDDIYPDSFATIHLRESLPPTDSHSDSERNLENPTTWGDFKNYGLHMFPNPYVCKDAWNYVSYSPTSSPFSTPPDSDHLPSPKTVREMLYWLVGVVELKYIGFIQKHVEGILTDIKKDTSKPTDALQITRYPNQLPASHVSDKLTEVCLYAAHVLNGIRLMKSKDALSPIDFKQVYSMFHYSSDPDGLLCQLHDYVYAAHHQLEFLKAQCIRDKSLGGWKTHEYGSDIKTPSPLQSFLTDSWDSTFHTHFFDPCNICLKSRIRMGFKKGDFSKSPKDASYLYYLLSPTCSVEDDPLMKLCSYLNCLTRRTPRTTGELVSFFHHFGNELHGYASKALSSLGTALSTSHADCPDWDRLDGTDLQAVKDIGGSESIKSISIHDSKHDHPRTLSALIGCCSDSANCPQYCSPITYQAYSLYSPIFAHTYLSWAVYLSDRLQESLVRLRYDLEGHGNTKCASLDSCPDALPLLYLHGFTPPEGMAASAVKCSDIITKLGEVVNGGPIADLMTAMDNFLYRVRMPFIYTLIALWSAAILLLSYTILYRLDVLYLCSHAIRSKASHLIDVKALLTNSRKMLSLYDADYFDDDPTDLIDQLN